jgi:hypothetical protein
MSFEAVWGFDPERVIQAVGLPTSEIETDKFTYSAGSSELRAYRLICTRRFMSSAECIDCDAVGREFPPVAPMYSHGKTIPRNLWFAWFPAQQPR